MHWKTHCFHSYMMQVGEKIVVWLVCFVLWFFCSGFFWFCFSKKKKKIWPNMSLVLCETSY